jgi:hypothetical protein
MANILTYDSDLATVSQQLGVRHSSSGQQQQAQLEYQQSSFRNRGKPVQFSTTLSTQQAATSP